jgi:hypothetical protein
MRRGRNILGSLTTTRNAGFQLPLRTSLVGSDGRVATFARASDAWYEGADGVIRKVTANVARQRSDIGTLVEEARTNRLVWSRDLTNAAWTKRNVTVARVADPTSLGGFINRVTVNANGGDFYQVMSGLPSVPRISSVRIRRVSGAGTVAICDGIFGPLVQTVGVEWSRPTYARTYISTGLQVQFGTAGDVFDVDWTGAEDGTFPTSPIETAGTALARAADVLAVGTQGWPVGAGRIGLRYVPIFADGSTDRYMFDSRSGPNNVGLSLRIPTDRSLNAFTYGWVGSNVTPPLTWDAGSGYAIGLDWSATATVIRRGGLSLGGGSGGLVSGQDAACRVGSNHVGGGFADGWLSDLEVSQ